MRTFFLAILLCLAFNLFGQVNLQTGSAQYAIPIFSYSDSKSGLGTNINLTYSSGNGLLVNDIAGNTGLGWNLLAGGSIVRRQNGEPDDQNSEISFPTHAYNYVYDYYPAVALAAEQTQQAYDYIANYYPNGYLYSEFPLDLTDDFPLRAAAPRELAFIPRFREAQDKNWKLSRRSLADRQQDVFVYNFGGKAGEFVIGKDNSVLLINSSSNLIVSKTTLDLTSQNIRTKINSFTITDANGVIYKFGAYELAEVLKFAEISREGPPEFQKIVSGGNATGKYTIQKWVLTEIINPITQEKIIFEYEDYDLDFVSEKIPGYQYSQSPTFETITIHEQRAKGKLKRLKNIILPNGHKVEFLYNTTINRIDVPGEFPLSQIKVSYNGQVTIIYDLSYGYFVKKEVKTYSDPIQEADKRFARMCLTAIQKSGNGIVEPAYKFEYYTGIESSDPTDLVPPRDCISQDHWGFYNKSLIDINNNNPSKEDYKFLMALASTYRQPTAGVAKFGLLKSIQNPFSGKLTFEYEQNSSLDSDAPYSVQTAGGVRVSKTISYDDVSTNNNIVTNYQYIKDNGVTSGWGYESPNYQLS